MKIPRRSMPKFLGLTIIFAGLIVGIQNSRAVVTSAGVSVLGSPSITKVSDLDFGEVVPSAGGAVIMDPSGTRIALGSVVLGAATGNPAEFTINGVAGAVYSVSTSPGPVILSGPGGFTMDIGSFVHNASGFFTTGTETFQVGGDLNVNPGQAPGLYSGTFDVDVFYN